MKKGATKKIDSFEKYQLNNVTTKIFSDLKFNYNKNLKMNLALIGGGDHTLEIVNYIIDDGKLYRKIEKFSLSMKEKKLWTLKQLSKKIRFFNNIKIKKNRNLKACISFGEPKLRKISYIELKKNKVLIIIPKTSYISHNAIISMEQ